jgi:hypothetical protein
MQVTAFYREGREEIPQRAQRKSRIFMDIRGQLASVVCHTSL